MVEKKKTQGMRRNLLHLCGVFIHHFCSIIFFSTANASFLLTIPNLYKKYRAHKVWKKTQGMRRNLGHKGCGWVTPPQFQSLPLSTLFSFILLSHPRLIFLSFQNICYTFTSMSIPIRIACFSHSIVCFLILKKFLEVFIDYFLICSY